MLRHLLSRNLLWSMVQSQFLILTLYLVASFSAFSKHTFWFFSAGKQLTGVSEVLKKTHFLHNQSNKKGHCQEFSVGNESLVTQLETSYM